MIKKAFTMAEAILVMTILGIVATIMISTLKPAEFKEKGLQILAKKVLSEIDTATTQIIMNDSADGTFEKLYTADTRQLFNAYSTADFSNNAERNEEVAKLYKKYLTAIRKDATDSGECRVSDEAGFYMKDGACFSVLVNAVTTNCDSIFPGETSKTTFSCNGYIIFDTNGMDEPNVWGKDLFWIPLGKEGIEY